MTADELLVVAQERGDRTGCRQCSALVCRAWESLSGDFDRSLLRRIGSLRDPVQEEPTYEEYHPHGTHAWSADAPIAPDWFPYNRCEVWECVACGRPFLRYTEFGGYYADERIRELRAERVVRLPHAEPPSGTAAG
ncbi:hypothetical protein O4H66_05980 [Comamonadaceae bacterium G21597-S1]|nr:hypothetical protein [Comamonadaceae bacterium G21597-S1]